MPFMKRSDDAHDANDAHPPRDGTDRAASRREMGGLAPARVAQVKREAEGLLVELYEATRGLGDAINRAGFSPGRWSIPEARLSTLSDRLPNVTVEALLARLADFALDTGPLWLAGSGEARGEFVHEVEALAAAIGPVAALARRGPTVATAGARGRGSLGQALRDGRVGTQLERLDETLGQLLELAQLLERMALPAELASAAAATFAAGGLQGEQEGNVAALPGWPFGQPAHDRTLSAVPGAKSTGRWPRSRLLQAVWSWRRTRTGVGIGLATLLLVLVLSGTVALLHGLSATHLGPASGAQAVATDTHGRGVTPSPARTAPAAAPTQAPGPPTAALAVSPGNVVLPCGGAAITLAVENTGRQTLNWQATVSGNAALSVTTGSVGAGSKATVNVHATATQHGPGDIVFTSNGGTVKVTFKVSCH